MQKLPHMNKPNKSTKDLFQKYSYNVNRALKKIADKIFGGTTLSTNSLSASKQLTRLIGILCLKVFNQNKKSIRSNAFMNLKIITHVRKKQRITLKNFIALTRGLAAQDLQNLRNLCQKLQTATKRRLKVLPSRNRSELKIVIITRFLTTFRNLNISSQKKLSKNQRAINPGLVQLQLIQDISAERSYLIVLQPDLSILKNLSKTRMLFQIEIKSKF